MAFHDLIRIVEEGIVGREFLTSLNVAHGNQHDVASESNVRLARMIEEEHHGLVLVVGECHKMKVIGNLYVGVDKVFGQHIQLIGRHNVTAFHGDDLPFWDRL